MHVQIPALIGKVQRKGNHPPLFAQLRDNLRLAILDGRLRPGERLPSEIEFAQLVGLAPVTVGRALADLSREGLVTRHRKRGTFVSGSVARRQARCGMVAIVLSTLADAAHPFAGDIVRSAERRLRGRGFSVCLVAPNESVHRQPPAPFAVPRDPAIVGTIILPEEADAAESRELLERMPAVFFQNTSLVAGAGGVRVDLHSAMEQVVRHLTDLGHRNVGLLLGPRDHRHPSVAEARDAALTLLKAAGVTVDDDWVLHERYGVDSGRALCARLLSQSARPSALICGDDFVAAGALQAADAAGLSVPGDLSVVGMNDMPVATLVTPRLTSVAVPAGEIGNRLAEMLLDQIDHRVSPGEVTLEPRLVVRQSTGPCRVSNAP